MADFFDLGLEEERVHATRSYEDILANADPEAMEQGGPIFPEEPFEVRSGDKFYDSK